MAGINFKVIIFHFAVTKKNIHGYKSFECIIFPYIISVYFLSNHVRREKTVIIFITDYLKYTNFIHKNVSNKYKLINIYSNSTNTKITQAVRPTSRISARPSYSVEPSDFLFKTPGFST